MFCVTFQVQLLQCLPKPNPKCFPATLVQHSSHSISMSSHLTLHHPLWFQIFSDLSCSCMQQNQAGTVKRARKKNNNASMFPRFLVFMFRNQNKMECYYCFPHHIVLQWSTALKSAGTTVLPIFIF